MKRQHFFWLLGVIFASSFTVAACTDDSSLLQPEAPAASESATAAIPSSPLDAALGTGQCMGNDAVNAANIVSGFGTNPLAFNCTAGDIRLANARTASGVPIQCVPGQPINDVDIVADIIQTSNSTRSDIGIWIENGDNGDGGAEDGACDFFYFDETDIATQAGVTSSDDPPDQCGDMVAAAEVNDFELGDLDLICPTDPVIVDGKTFIEIASCVSWTQPGGDRVCPIPTESTPEAERWGTLPANKSKCNCEPFLVEVDIQAQLTLVKTVVNDDGGTLGVSDFPLFINGNGVTSGVANTLSAGNYTASETPQAGYAASAWGGDCAADGTITLAPGDVKTCTITNDDIAPTLTLVKTVVNDDGGTLGVSDFPLFIDGNGVTSGVANAVAAGAHTASETPQAGYTAGSWGGDCAADGTITLALDQDATCTITNDDQGASLTLVKTVINDDGGTLGVSDFPLFIDGNAVTSGVSNGLSAGNYTASETQQAGYAASAWGGDCAADGTVTLGLGESKTCTITNDDIAPTLTLVKTVINDDGGTLGVSDFPLFIDGNGVTSGVANTVLAGAHTASETQQAGYTAGSWGGDCAADGTITLALDQDATCTITNDDIAPTLTLVKTVINDDGGTLGVSDFPLFIDGNGVTSGVANTVLAGAHTASETQQAGYTAGSWGGDCAADGTITLALDQDATCTITNDDIPQATCEAGDRVTSVTLLLVSSSPDPILIGVTDDNGPNPDLLFEQVVGSGQTFTIVPDGGGIFFDSQNLRFFLDGEASKDLKVHLSCSDDPMVGDIHAGSANGASATLQKTSLQTTQFN